MWVIDITTFGYFFPSLYILSNKLSLKVAVVSLLVELSDLAVALLTVALPSQDHDHHSPDKTDCNDV